MQTKIPRHGLMLLSERTATDYLVFNNFFHSGNACRFLRAVKTKARHPQSAILGRSAGIGGCCRYVSWPLQFRIFPMFL